MISAWELGLRLLRHIKRANNQTCSPTLTQRLSASLALLHDVVLSK